MNRINGKIKTIWGISEVGFSVMATMETSFFVFFLTDVAQMPLAIVAAITGSSAIIDAVSAVIAGIVIDKVKFRDCKFRKWLLICPPFVTIFFVSLISTYEESSSSTSSLLSKIKLKRAYIIKDNNMEEPYNPNIK